jgi:hypothetical protein
VSAVVADSDGAFVIFGACPPYKGKKLTQSCVMIDERTTGA